MTDAWVIACVLILFRVTAFVMFMPPLAGQGLPSTVKVGLSVALTAMWVSVHSNTAALHLYQVVSGSTAWIQLGFLVLRETLLGIGLAWLFGLCMVPVRTAGAWIAQEMGLTIAGLTSPMDQQPTNVVSQCLEALGVLMFFALNLHHVVFFALGRTFDVRPVGTGWLIPSWDNVVDAVSRSINQGLLIIALIGILLFITLLILLVTIRTAPQFNFMSYGMTLRLIVGGIAGNLWISGHRADVLRSGRESDAGGCCDLLQAFGGGLESSASLEGMVMRLVAGVADVARSGWQLGLTICIAMAGFSLALALADYLVKWLRNEQKLKMTREEVKQEQKDDSGDPQVKAAVRRRQREARRRQSVSDVPKATVILTNPTHLAVAIQYQQGMAAPRVVAKGAGVFAKNILRIAGEHRIPVLERKPLARALFRSVDVGEEIPFEFFRAVAD